MWLEFYHALTVRPTHYNLQQKTCDQPVLRIKHIITTVITVLYVQVYVAPFQINAMCQTANEF